MPIISYVCMMGILALMPAIFISDMLTTLTGVNVSTLFRGGLLFLVLLYSISQIETSKKIKIILFSILIFIPQILAFLIHGDFTALFSNANFSLKFLSIFVWYFFSTVIDDRWKKTYINTTYFTLLLYIGSIVFSALFNVDVMKTYDDTGRFGFKGVIPAANETSALLLISTFWLLMNTVKENSIFNWLAFMLSMFSCILIGTKAAILIALIGIIKTVTVSSDNVYRNLIIFILSSFVVFQVLNNYDLILESIESSIDYFNSKIGSVELDDWIFILLSGRNEKLELIISSFFSDSKYYYYLIFGGYPISSYMSEMDLFDCLFLFGFFLGPVLYALYFSLVYKMSDVKVNGRIIPFTLLGISVLSGHVVFSMVFTPFFTAFYISSRMRQS